MLILFLQADHCKFTFVLFTFLLKIKQRKAHTSCAKKGSTVKSLLLKDKYSGDPKQPFQEKLHLADNTRRCFSE